MAKQKGSEKLPITFYRKVIKSTNGRLINLTPVIPKDWKLVKVRCGLKTEQLFILTVERLAGENNHAQSPTSNKTDKQDTSKTR